MKNPVPFNYLKSDNIEISLRLQQFPGTPSREGVAGFFGKRFWPLKKLALFGFVFLGHEGSNIVIILCIIDIYVHIWPLKKLGLFIRTIKSSFFL
jgi:hypothetical protein